MDSLSCTICTKILTDTRVIKCGHSFCEKCITDWINLKNNCPICKESAKADEIVKDYTLEEIKFEVIKQREKYEKENLLDKYKLYNKDSEVKLNEFHQIFFNSLKGIFTTYENFLISIEDDYQKQVEEIEKCLSNKNDSQLKDVNEFSILSDKVDLMEDMPKKSKFLFNLKFR